MAVSKHKFSEVFLFLDLYYEIYFMVLLYIANIFLLSQYSFDFQKELVYFEDSYEILRLIPKR